MKHFDLYYRTQIVGWVEVHKSGMFCKIVCRFRIEKKKRYRLFISNGRESQNLGLCVPYGDCFGTECIFPASKCLDDSVQFCVMEDEVRCYEASDTEPFPYLSELENAILTYSDGVLKIVIQPPGIIQN